jgi:hypothetical protein
MPFVNADNIKKHRRFSMEQFSVDIRPFSADCRSQTPTFFRGIASPTLSMEQFSVDIRKLRQYSVEYRSQTPTLYICPQFAI